ncbi:MAG: ABC transporter permease subunit [Desulfofustis sp.]|nr:ABC transporter permease subunit [Desulfofustis sp.]
MIYPGTSTAPVRPTGRTATTGTLCLLLGPSLAVVIVLFAGGLVLGLLQAAGYMPGGGFSSLTATHVRQVLLDPELLHSFGLTFYISAASTLIACLASVLLAVTLINLADRSRAIYFLLQLPLTVPHLVIAISVLLLLSPSGLIARLGVAIGLIADASSFPLLVNDRLGIGILAVYVWKEIPFITFMLLAVLKNMGTELLEAGATLKATRQQRFFHIILPILAPALGASGLIVFAFTFGAFEVPYLLGRTHPLLLPVWAYRNYSDIDLFSRPEGIALGLLIAVIIIISIVLSHQLLGFARKRGIGA